MPPAFSFGLVVIGALPRSRDTLFSALTEAEVALLTDTVARLGGARVGDAVLDLDGAALARWLVDPNAG